MDDTLILIGISFSEMDLYGVRQKVETRNEVFCKVSDVTRSEFFGGGRAGLNPDKTFVISAIDYSGESVVEYAGNRYAIYRTYHVPATDYMELHVQREGGINAESND